MKKLLSVILSVFLIIFTASITGCSKKSGKYLLCVPDGAPALSVSKIIEDGIDGEDITTSIVSASMISTAVTVDKADFVIIPILAATKLYNADKKNTYSMLSVITHGNFYFLSSFSLSEVSDLIGKIVLIPQNRNTVPDLTLKAILKAAGISYADSDTVVTGKVALSYLGSGSQVIAKLPMGGSSDYVAYLPEPAATNLSNKKTAYSIKLSCQELYDSDKKSYPQAVLLGKNSTIKNNPNIVDKLKEAISKSVIYSKENPNDAIKSIKENFSASELPLSLSKTSVVNCNIYWGEVKDEKQNVINYVNRIRGISPDSASALLDEFFYEV